MDISLERVLVPTQGLHDPLDALVTYFELSAGSKRRSEHKLTREIQETRAMVAVSPLQTRDELGVGALLTSLYRLSLGIKHSNDHHQEGIILARLIATSNTSLHAYMGINRLEETANSRLAFRELGLAIGLKALELTSNLQIGERNQLNDGTKDAFEQLLEYLPIQSRIVNFWSQAKNRTCRSWTDHADINTVMLATALSPLGYLGCLSE